MGGTVGFFGHSVGGVFCDAQTQHPGGGGQFLFQSLNIRINEVRVRKHPLGIAELVDGGVPVGKILPKGCQVQFFQPPLGQVGCFAFAFPFELAVALPDNTTVTVGGVPGLCSKNIAAVGTDDLPGEGAGLMVPVAAVFAPFQFHLNLLPFPGFDDGGVAVLHIVLGDLSLIDLGFLGEKIHREGLLKQSRALVLFVPQNALHGGSLPDGLFPGGRDALLRQHGGNGIGGFPLKELTVDTSDGLRFLRNDLRQPIGTFSVTQELAVGDADLAVGEPFPLSPGDILGNLFYSLKAPYRKNAIWILNDATVKAIRKLKNGSGDYLWQPALKDGDVPTILGRPYFTSQFAPTIEAGAKVMAFGDFSYYWIGDRQGISFKRLNELYAGNGQIGFLASKRLDGKLVLSEAVKVLQMKA